MIGSPKFYFAVVGVVNHLARRGRIVPGGELFGKAFENWVIHELQALRAYHDPSIELAHWRLASGIEVDFIIGNMEVAIEAKATPRIVSDQLNGLRHLRQDHPRVRCAIVCLEPRRRITEGIEIVPASVFARDPSTILAG